MAYQYKGVDITTLLEPRGSFAVMSIADFDKYLVNGVASLYQQYAERMYLKNPLGGTYKRNGIAIEPAMRGSMPIATQFLALTSSGTYTITRTDSVLTIGSSSFYANSFPRINAIPKVIGVLLIGGGGGGGGSGGMFVGGGCGGGAGGYCIGVMNLTTGQSMSVTVGGGGGGGSAGSSGGSGGYGGDGGSSRAYVGSDQFYAGGGWGGQGGWGGSSSSGGSGGVGGGHVASDLSDFTVHRIATGDGGNGGWQNVDGYTGTSISGYLSQPISAARISFSSSAGGDHHAGTQGGYGYGGGGGGGYGRGGDGGTGFSGGSSGGVGAGGGGGSAGITSGNSGGSGGGGRAFFYY